MFYYDCIDVTYTVVYGKLYSGEGDYTFELNKKEAEAYTKARMLGKELEETINLCRCEREIIRYEKEEHDEDISNLEIHITLCDEGEQPPFEDVEDYLKDLLKAHRILLAHEVVLAQINIYNDIETDWKQVALDLAMEVNCVGYAKKYKNGKFSESQWEIERKNYFKLHPELIKDNKLKCGEKVRSTKRNIIRDFYYKGFWFVRRFDMSYTDEKDKVKRLRGCKLLEIGPPSYILTNSGKKVKVNNFGFFEPYFYGIGLCPYDADSNTFSVRNLPDTGEYYLSRNLFAGKWGFIDTEGNVVIEPQYVYAVGAFGPEDKEFFVVARLVGKKQTRWGILDYNGCESIPCQYASIKHIDCFWNNVFPTPIDILEYQEEVDGLYGLIKIDGTVIIPPMFGYIGNCYFGSKYNFIIAGNDMDFEGVFSLDKKEYIISPSEDTDCSIISYSDEKIRIKVVHNSETIYYDYDGVKLSLNKLLK